MEQEIEESLINRFTFERLLKQDQAGRRICLYGQVDDKPAVLIFERAAFSVSEENLSALSSSLASLENLDANDVFHWYRGKSPSQTDDLKITLFYPASEKHIRKYSAQPLHIVHETPEMYRDHIKPFMAKSREPARMQWVKNILAGEAEAENVIYRTPKSLDTNQGFVLLPDMNWDRAMVETLHLLVLVEREDIWSLRDLKKKHVAWLWQMREAIINATIAAYPGLQEDEMKLYVHYLPTSYHFHIHVVHVSLDAGATQAWGKAVGYESLISQLQTMAGDAESGMDSALMTYTVGEADLIWVEVLQPLLHGSPN